MGLLVQNQKRPLKDRTDAEQASGVFTGASGPTQVLCSFFRLSLCTAGRVIWMLLPCCLPCPALFATHRDKPMITSLQVASHSKTDSRQC